MIQFCVTNRCKLTALLSWTQPHRDDLQARSEAEGKHNVNYRCDLGVHWSLWSRRLLLMDHPTLAISLHPLLFLIFHLSLSTNAGHCSSQSEMIFRRYKRARSYHSVIPHVLWRRQSSVCSVSQHLSLQINQTSSATEVERAAAHQPYVAAAEGPT